MKTRQRLLFLQAELRPFAGVAIGVLRGQCGQRDLCAFAVFERIKAKHLAFKSARHTLVCGPSCGKFAEQLNRLEVIFYLRVGRM